MKHYVELGVLVKESTNCLIDETGRTFREAKAISHRADRRFCRTQI